MNLIYKVAMISIVLISINLAHADADDVKIAKSCTGLSHYFYNKSRLSPDLIDEEILSKIMAPDLQAATILNRAKVIGSASACGEEVTTEWEKLQAQASKTFNNDSTQSKRFVQVVECTKVRFEKVGLTGNWAVTTLRFCPQAKENFMFYVKDGKEFSEKAPQLETNTNK